VQEAGEVQVGAGLAIDILQVGELLEATLQVDVGVAVSS
jgi:hypothetical protein